MLLSGLNVVVVFTNDLLSHSADTLAVMKV